MIAEVPIDSTVPLCADCTQLVGRRNLIELADQWKCGHKANVNSVGRSPVSGKTIYHYITATCDEARAPGGPCGPEGTLFEKYVIPVVLRPTSNNPHASRPAGARPSADDLLAELGS